MQNNPLPVYQSQQIREFEQLAEKRFDIAAAELMQRAGQAAFNFLIERFPQTKKITVFCGSGNNGGDGYVLARKAHEQGLKVIIWQVGDAEKLKSDAKEALEACQKANISIKTFNEKENIEQTDIIIDAICGIGVHQHLRDDAVKAIEKMQSANIPILSIDIPSGIDADTGRLLGKAVQACATITFIALKLGLLTGSGIAHTGELVVSDLQLPEELFSLVPPIAEKIRLDSFSDYLKPRPRDWHKGLSGSVLIIGGEMGFSGAPRMAAEAALRVGAGLVTVATRPENAVIMNVDCPEIMCHGISTAAELKPLLNKADVVAIGPGLGTSEWAKSLLEFIYEKDLPMVIDADGLNLLAQDPKYHANWVLTPHPGEAARLLDKTSQDIQQDRLSAANAINKKYGGVCVLKGAGTLIVAEENLPAVCDQGNPGMASAGLGDVLTGVIAGLIAQGIPLDAAAKLGVSLHAEAGDLAAREGGERGLVAMDLMPFLRHLVNLSSV